MGKKLPRGAAGNTLYESVALRLAGLIEKGAYRAGDRVPSVRQVSEQQRMSVTTVLAAYRMLEDRGFIEARPQSGYYVRTRELEHFLEPTASEPHKEPTEVSVRELVMMVQRDMGQPHLVQLGIVVPPADLVPADRMGRALAVAARQIRRGVAYYSHPNGHEALRKQLARRIALLDCDVPPDELVITVGAQEAITLALRATCKHGDTVAVESPTYHGVLQAIESLGLRALELPSHPRDGVSLDALRDALEEKKVQAVFLITNYSNPTGSCLTTDRKRELVELLTLHDVPLIEDDVSGDLCHTNARPTVAKRFDTKGLVLMVSSVSKTLAPGFRIGWIAPGRYYDQVEYLKMVSSIATQSAQQVALADYFATSSYDRFLRGIRPVYARRVEGMTRALLAHFPAGTRVTRPGGGYALWVELPREVDSLKLYAGAVKAGITFSPGPLFSARGRYRNCLRINSAFFSPEVERAIATLGRIAKSLQ